MLYPERMPLIRTTMEPWREIFVTDFQYLGLLRQGLIYTGATVPPPPAFNDAQYAELARPDGEAAERIIEAIGASSIVDQVLGQVTISLAATIAQAAAAIPAAQKGSVNGVATLDAGGRVPDGQLPDRLTPANLLAATRDVVDGTIMNAQAYGVVPGGSGLGIAASKAKWTQLVALFNASPRTRTIFFPGAADAYIIDAGAVFSKTVKLAGDNRDASKLLVADNSMGDVITFNGSTAGRSSQITDLSIDGNKDGGARGDLIVLDVGYCQIQNSLLLNAGGTAIRQGKTARAIITRLDGLIIRLSLDYGVWVQQDSTDALWNNLDIGTCGLSGVRVESSSQNMSNVHVWGCGTRAVPGDASGFLILASGQQMGTCQAETNWEDGFTFQGNDQNGAELAGCKSWANGWAGFAFIGFTRPDLAACKAYDNALRNLDGPTSTNRRYSGFYNNGSNHGLMAACRANDRSVARDITTPSPIMSKPAAVTQVYGYAEETGSTPFGWAWSACGLGTVMINGNGSTFEGNRGLNSVVDLVLTGNTAPIRADHKVVRLTHATTGTDVSFNSLGTDSQIGRIITLIIEQTNILIFENANIKLVNGAYRGAAGKQITLIFNGTKWAELNRATIT